MTPKTVGIGRGTEISWMVKGRVLDGVAYGTVQKPAHDL